jgi:hypothetical protein
VIANIPQVDNNLSYFIAVNVHKSVSLRLNVMFFFSLLTEMSTRYIKIMFLGSKVRPVRGADNFATICEPII